MIFEHIDELELEREKLDQLIEEAIRNGTLLCEKSDIMKQAKKVNELILKTKEE